MTSEKILFVDDEPNILEGYRRALRRSFEIETAESGAAGLEAIRARGPFAVVVSDMRMPEMDGIQFLAEVKQAAPESVRIMLTGNADQQTAIDAVNEGNIFRFLTKPCSPESLMKVLTAGIEQHRLVMAEKDLLKRTLTGSVQMLTDILSQVNPTAFGRASRVRAIVTKLTKVLAVENSWQVEIAAMLSQVGFITVPEETLMKVYDGRYLSAKELQMLRSYPQVGHELIAHIPRLEPIAEIVAYQEKLYRGSGAPFDDEKHGEEIPFGARILKVALDYDKLTESGFSKTDALAEMQRRGNWYDPTVVAALKTSQANDTEYETELVNVDELASNMILAEDITSIRGLPLATKGQEVTHTLKLRLQNLVWSGVVKEPIKVYVTTLESDGADHPPRHLPSETADRDETVQKQIDYLSYIT